MASAIVAEGLVKRYGRILAVDRLNLCVRQGTIYGLLGPDGAGKTSLIRCLCGSTEYQDGSLRILGLEVSAGAGRLRPLIGYMPQTFSLYSDLTIAENLDFFCDVYGVPAGERADRIPRLLAMTRLEGHRNRPAGHLSGGMKQKLALCVALAHGPKVLLLDEPSTGVDPVSRRDFWAVLLNLKTQGVSILVSTPYMDEAEKCDTVGMIISGRILVEGVPEELRRRFPFKIIAVSAEPLFPARQALGRIPGVKTAVMHGDVVDLVVDDAAGVLEGVPRAMEAAGVRLLGIRETAPGLEDVFVHEIESRGGREGLRTWR